MICAPADPTFEEKELEEVAKATQTDPGDWGFPVSDGVEVRAAPQPKAPVSEKLGLHFVRVMPDQPAPTAQNQAPMLKIVTPSGKVGYVSAMPSRRSATTSSATSRKAPTGKSPALSAASSKLHSIERYVRVWIDEPLTRTTARSDLFRGDFRRSR